MGDARLWVDRLTPRQMVNSSQPEDSEEEARETPLGGSLPKLLLALDVDIT